MQGEAVVEKIGMGKAVILGILQGATEFLPISSSGHLVFGNHFLEGIPDPEAMTAFVVVLHLATLLAVLIVFWKEIFSLFGPNAKVILLVAIGTVPAVVVGLAAKVYLEQAFDKLWVAGIGFFITSYFLLSHEKYKETDERIERTLKMMTIGNALLIGLAQALAILPGASRSGLTICTARLLRVDRSAAASFSFLLAIPAIGGAAVIEMEALQDLHLVAEPGAVLAGFIAALVTGLVSLLLLLRMLKWGRFAWFAPYTIVLGIVAIWLSVVGG